MAWSLVFFILRCFYLMLPSYFANMAPVIVKKINLFRQPLDFGKKLGSRPVFGKNKTFRGFVFGIAFAVIVAYAQFLLYGIGVFKSISFVDYRGWLFFGILSGTGALTGDLAKSFFKRRLGIKPGEKFVPFDQTDFILGSFLFIAPFFKIDIKIFLTSLVLSFLLHIIVNHAAYYLGIRQEKW